MCKQRGLSLLELVAGLVILSILFFLCLPFGLSFLQSNQLEVVKDELTAAVQYARTRALLEGHPLLLTPLTDDWSLGMRLIVDNKKHHYLDKTQLIHEWRWTHQGIRVSWQGLHTNRYLVFAPDLKHSASSGHFIIQNENGKTLKLTLNRLGRIRLQNQTAQTP